MILKFAEFIFNFDTCYSTCNISFPYVNILFIGADKTQITAGYKRLATKWYPEKHNNNREAIKVRQYHQLLCSFANKSSFPDRNFKKSAWPFTS